MSRLLLPLALLLLLTAAPAAFAQGPPNPPANREAMWPAPTAEDWAKPCLITFQRTWADAVAVSRETGKPLLICINMDGEIASEHWAGKRYRDPETAELYEPYVCVIASVYRHTPQDFDAEGRRILCPRFGSVTCGEHITIEPIVYEKYLDEQRIAPRHIMVELDGSEKYDIFYRNDVASIIEDVRKGIETREAKPKPVVRGDRSIVERVASPDVKDRQAVEGAYAEGDSALRRSLLEAAKKLEGATPLDLLRLAVFGLDTEMSRLARAALAKTDSTAATDLIVDALRVPMDKAEREALVAALERLGENSPRARWLAAVHEGLSVRDSGIDVGAWSKGGGKYEAPPALRELAELEARRERSEKARQETPDDPEACISLAEASLALAMKARRTDTDDPRVAQVFARHLFEDAARSARKAEALGVTDVRTNTVLALASYYRGDPDGAYERAATAARELEPGDSSWNAMAVLTIFAEGRYRMIKQAARDRKRWQGQWLADLDSAYNALLSHPLATESQLLWHYDFLLWLGAKRRASNYLRSCLNRFPDSPTVHGHLRTRILEDRGAGFLESEYEALLEREDAPRDLEWFAGYASLVAAEYHRRDGRAAEAGAAYDRAIAHYDRAVELNPRARETSDHYVALALAAKARMAWEADDDEAALAAILASFARRPDAAGTADGLGITPAATAQMLLARLVENGRTDLAEPLTAAMEKLDPELLVPKEE